VRRRRTGRLQCEKRNSLSRRSSVPKNENFTRTSISVHDQKEKKLSEELYNETDEAPSEAELLNNSNDTDGTYKEGLSLPKLDEENCFSKARNYCFVRKDSKSATVVSEQFSVSQCEESTIGWNADHASDNPKDLSKPEKSHEWFMTSLTKDKSESFHTVSSSDVECRQIGVGCHSLCLQSDVDDATLSLNRSSSSSSINDLGNLLTSSANSLVYCNNSTHNSHLHRMTFLDIGTKLFTDAILASSGISIPSVGFSPLTVNGNLLPGFSPFGHIMMLGGLGGFYQQIQSMCGVMPVNRSAVVGRTSPHVLSSPALRSLAVVEDCVVPPQHLDTLAVASRVKEILQVCCT